MAHPIVHVEIPANDPKSAAAFYGEVFGWQIETDPTYDYHMFAAAGGPGGGFVKAGASEEGMTYKINELRIYIGTDDIDATLARIESNGGKTLVPKTEIPHVGWFGVFADPSGNQVALYTSIPRQ